ncbi:MAG: thiamine-phosphate kinase, partial [Burkholderiales bacterium]
CRYADPRVALGRALRGRASAAMDVSDGLLGDLAKLCEASGVGAVLDLERLPVSGELAQRHSAAECERLVLSGGDDYELLFTAAPDQRERILQAAADTATTVSRIGDVTADRALVILDESGQPLPGRFGGYDHFA